MATVATVATAVTAATVVAIATEAKVTATEVQVAMVVDMVHRMAPLRLQLLQLPLTLTLKLLITTPSTRSGPLTTLRTHPKIHTLPTAASQQSWPSTLKATDSTMVKLTQPDRHSLLRRELPHRRHHLQSLLAMELLHRLRRRPPLRQELATVQFLLHLACKCFATSSISPKCIEHRVFHLQLVRRSQRNACILGFDVGDGITQQIPETDGPSVFARS
jgi:hypothetical protein